MYYTLHNDTTNYRYKLCSHNIMVIYGVRILKRNINSYKQYYLILKKFTKEIILKYTSLCIYN